MPIRIFIGANIFNWSSVFLNFFFNDKIFEFNMLVFREVFCKIITINFQQLDNIVEKSKSWNKVLERFARDEGSHDDHISYH